MAKSVLVVDDNRNDYRLYQSAILELGHESVPAVTAEEALEKLRKSPDVGAVFVLWELPEPFPGPHLMAKIRLLFPLLPVIVTSSTLNLQVAAKAKSLGARDFLMKPLDQGTLRDTLVKWLETPGPDPIVAQLRERLMGVSEAFLETLKALAMAIPHSNTSILLIGESGTGKELLARAVHDLGPRRKGPWVAVNVTTIPGHLIESEFFGHEAGAFTDAKETKRGLFELVGNGTLFLDEIGDMSFEMQMKLLRVLAERKFRRIGGSQEIPFNARLECATHHNLALEVATGKFREDLYFRINEYEIRVPPLRERGRDIEALCAFFIRKYADGADKKFSDEAMSILKSHGFRGNVRELENLVKRVLVQCRGPVIGLMDLPIDRMVGEGQQKEPDRRLAWPEAWLDFTHAQAMEQVERSFNSVYLVRKFKEAKGKVLPAARKADMDPKTWRKKWKECGLYPSEEEGGQA